MVNIVVNINISRSQKSMIDYDDNNSRIDILCNENGHHSVDIAIALVLGSVELSYPIEGDLQQQIHARNESHHYVVQVVLGQSIGIPLLTEFASLLEKYFESIEAVEVVHV